MEIYRFLLTAVFLCTVGFQSYAMNTLHKAVKEGPYELICELLNQDHSAVNSHDDNGNTPLIMVFERSTDDILEVVNLLLEYDADPSKCSNMGGTPLHAAAYYGNIAIIERLLSFGEVDVNAKKLCGRTPLMNALINECNDAAVCLVNAGATLTEEELIYVNELMLLKKRN